MNVKSITPDHYVVLQNDELSRRCILGKNETLIEEGWRVAAAARAQPIARSSGQGGGRRAAAPPRGQPIAWTHGDPDGRRAAPSRRSFAEENLGQRRPSRRGRDVQDYPSEQQAS